MKVMKIKHREQHRATKNIIHKIARRKKKVASNFLKLIRMLYFTKQFSTHTFSFLNFNYKNVYYTKIQTVDIFKIEKNSSSMLLHENRALGLIQ